MDFEIQALRRIREHWKTPLRTYPPLEEWREKQRKAALQRFLRELSDPTSKHGRAFRIRMAKDVVGRSLLFEIFNARRKREEEERYTAGKRLGGKLWKSKK